MVLVEGVSFAVGPAARSGVRESAANRGGNVLDGRRSHQKIDGPYS